MMIMTLDESIGKIGGYVFEEILKETLQENPPWKTGRGTRADFIGYVKVSRNPPDQEDRQLSNFRAVATRRSRTS